MAKAKPKKSAEDDLDDEKKSKFDELRDNIQQQLEQQKEQQKREMMRQRVDIAKTGIRSYEGKNYREAVRNFTHYLRIMEDWKKTAQNGLKPSMFKDKGESGELLLIAGIYWDLAKIYDKARTAEKLKEMRVCLDKYVEFTKGQSYQPLAAESMRKYLVTDKASHRGDFNAAYKKLTGGKNCFVMTALHPWVDMRSIRLLRAFRDRSLARSTPGWFLIRAYYGVGPGLAKCVVRFPLALRRLLGRGLSYMVHRLASLSKKRSDS